GGSERYPTRTALDTNSKPLAVIDPLGRHIQEFCLREPVGAGFRYVAAYDLTGKPLYVNSMDSGAKRTLENAVGKPLRAWDARGFASRMVYDAAHRPTRRYVDRPGLGEILAERSVYGERHPDATLNLRGVLFRHYDSAGMVAIARRDFKG